MKYIDINCDMGEIGEAVDGGIQEALMPSLTSVNIACGGHAGDERTMRRTIEQALHAGVAVGAHPGYPDRENFGRLALQMPLEAVSDFVFEQVVAFAAAANEMGTRVAHVKAHGALYNQAVHNGPLAEAIAIGVARWSRDVTLMGLAGSPMLDVFHQAGFTVAAEAFADRKYEPDGTLRARKFADALIEDPERAADQALRMASHGFVIASDGSEVAVNAQTICIHGDTPGSVAIAAAVAGKLRQCGIELRSL